MYNQANCHPGCVALAMFSPDLRRAIVDFVLSTGDDAIQQTARCQSEYVQMYPALGFIHANIPIEALVNIARALRVVLGDALAGQWDIDQYTLALTRAGSIPADEARRLATEQIVTKDASVLSFARRLLLAVPDLPGPIDEVGKGILGGALGVLDSLVPLDWVNSSGDVLYEWNNMGEVLGKLALRAKLTAAEVVYEKAPVPEGQKEEMAGDLSASIPLLARAVIGLLGKVLEFGDVDDGTMRDDMHELAAEVGDLMTEYFYLRPEQGGLGSFFKKVGRVASKVAKGVARVGLPVAGALVGGPLGGALTSGVVKALGGSRNAAAVQAAANAAGSLPAARFPVTNGRVSLTTLQRAVRALQSAGIDPNS